MSSQLIAAVHIGASIFSQNVPQQARINRLAPHFSPRFDQILELQPVVFKNLLISKDPYKARGFITVTPPPNSCWIVQRDLEIPDEVVCAPTQLYFRLSDIDFRGQLHWKITTGHGDDGTEVTWQSPYRLMQRARGGKLFKESIGEYIVSCEAFKGSQRRIVVKGTSGRQWIINYPEYDVMMPQPPKGPNLIVVTNIIPANPGGEGAEAPPEGAGNGEQKEPTAAAAPEGADQNKDQKPADPKDPKDPNAPSGGSAFTSKKKTGPIDPTIEFDPSARPEDKIDKKDVKLDMFTALVHTKKLKLGYHWNLSEHETYLMPASQIVTIGAPSNDKGVCRYRFKKSPFDPRMGMVEYTFTESEDALLIPTTCSNDLGPIIPPKTD